MGDNQPATNWASDQHCHRSDFYQQLFDRGWKQAGGARGVGRLLLAHHERLQPDFANKQGGGQLQIIFFSTKGVAREFSQEWRGGAWMHIGWQRDAVKYWDLDGRHKLLRPQTKSDLFH